MKLDKKLDSQIAYSAVAVPGEADSDGEILTPEEIEYASHKFLENYRIVDPDHACQNPYACKSVGVPVESYITPVEQVVKNQKGEDIVLPKGSWVVGLKIEDKGVWKSICDGTRRGVSLTGIPDTSIKSVNPKRVLIRDLGEKWEAKTVSIVSNPAVPKAEFFSLKESDDVSLKNFIENRIKEAIFKNKESVKMSQKEDKKLNESVKFEGDFVTKSDLKEFEEREWLLPHEQKYQVLYRNEENRYGEILLL